MLSGFAKLRLRSLWSGRGKTVIVLPQHFTHWQEQSWKYLDPNHGLLTHFSACFLCRAATFHTMEKNRKGRDKCNLTAHNIPFPVLCSTFSVILSQLKNCLMLMQSDLDIKHQPGSLLAGRVGLHVPSHTNSSLQAIQFCWGYQNMSIHIYCRPGFG